MSRADQVLRQAERDEEEYARMLAAGEISREQFDGYMRDLRADLRGAQEDDELDAIESVRGEWGGW